MVVERVRWQEVQTKEERMYIYEKGKDNEDCRHLGRGRYLG